MTTALDVTVMANSMSAKEINKLFLELYRSGRLNTKALQGIEELEVQKNLYFSEAQEGDLKSSRELRVKYNMSRSDFSFLIPGLLYDPETENIPVEYYDPVEKTLEKYSRPRKMDWSIFLDLLEKLDYLNRVIKSKKVEKISWLPVSIFRSEFYEFKHTLLEYVIKRYEEKLNYSRCIAESGKIFLGIRVNDTDLEFHIPSDRLGERGKAALSRIPKENSESYIGHIESILEEKSWYLEFITEMRYLGPKL